MRKAKRRKVWVNEFSDLGGTLGSLAWSSRGLAQRAGRQEADPVKAIPFVETRPGDVVLSREDREALADELEATRRKVWAVVDDDGRGSQVFTTLTAAKRWVRREPRDGTKWHIVPYAEVRRGEVVLKGKDVDRLRSIIDSTLGVTNVELCIEAFKLLRGA